MIKVNLEVKKKDYRRNHLRDSVYTIQVRFK